MAGVGLTGKQEALLLGLAGPEARVTPLLASMFAPALRNWFEMMLSEGASRETLAEAKTFVEVVELLAADYRRRVSAGGHEHGHLQDVRTVRADADLGMDRELSVKEAADRLHAGERHVVRLLDRGLLRGRKVGRAWLVDPRSVEDVRRIQGAAS